MGVGVNLCGGGGVWWGELGGMGMETEHVFFLECFSSKKKQISQILGFLFTTFKDACSIVFMHLSVKQNCILHAAAGVLKSPKDQMCVF